MFFAALFLVGSHLPQRKTQYQACSKSEVGSFTAARNAAVNNDRSHNFFLDSFSQCPEHVHGILLIDNRGESEEKRH